MCYIHLHVAIPSAPLLKFQAKSSISKRLKFVKHAQKNILLNYEIKLLILFDCLYHISTTEIQIVMLIVGIPCSFNFYHQHLPESAVQIPEKRARARIADHALTTTYRNPSADARGFCSAQL